MAPAAVTVRRLAIAVAGLALVAAAFAPASAQAPVRAVPPRAAAGPPAPLALAAGPAFASRLAARADTVAPGVAFLASAVVPGAGQYLQGADRWFPYVIVEAWAVLTFVDHRADARRFERRYRDLAWSVARRASMPPRRDSVFEYYEDMARFAASGELDRDPRTAGIQPELDAETFNGQLWLLARALFPTQDEALRYYESRAVGPAYTWAWGDSNLERQAFVELIRESDEAFREATTALGVLVANHMVSAVDALVLARLRSAGVARLRLRSGLEGAPRGARWSAALTLHF